MAFVWDLWEFSFQKTWQHLWFLILIVTRSLLFKNMLFCSKWPNLTKLNPEARFNWIWEFWSKIDIFECKCSKKTINVVLFFEKKISSESSLTENKISITYWEVTVHLLNFNTSQNNCILREFLNVWLINNKLYIWWTF